MFDVSGAVTAGSDVADIEAPLPVGSASAGIGGSVNLGTGGSPPDAFLFEPRVEVVDDEGRGGGSILVEAIGGTSRGRIEAFWKP